MRKPKLTVKEMAQVIQEALNELRVEWQDESRVQARIDWMIGVLESNERNEANSHRRMFQAIRAELFRLGVKHSNQF